MTTTLHVNDNVMFLNDFTPGYIGNVLYAIVRFLGNDFKNVTVCIESDEIHIYTENGEVNIDRDNVSMLIENTIRGMLSPLKGVLWLQKITITSNSC